MRQLDKQRGLAVLMALAAVAMLPVCAHPQAKPADALNSAPAEPGSEIFSQQLKNGLKLLFMPDHSAPVATVQVWYRAGSRNEQQGKRGLAHLVEHMMFKGSKNVAPEAHARIIASVGGRDNAFTTEDVTAYFETVPVDRLPLALDLEAERMARLKIDASQFFKEREVVKEEIRMRQQNDPWGALFEKFNSVAFTTHPYRFPVGGSLEDLDNIQREDVEAFYKTYYAPNNAVLVIVGDSDFATVKKMVEGLFAAIPSKAAPPTMELVEPEQHETRHEQLYFPTQLPAVLAAYKTPEASNDDTVVLDVINTLLGEGRSARMHQALVRDQKLAAFVAVFNEDHLDPSLFSMLAAYLPGGDPAKVEAAMVDQVERLVADGPSPEELQKAKTQLTAGYIFDLTSVERLGFRIGFAETVKRDYRKFLQGKTAYDAVSADDVKRVAAKYMTRDRLTVAYLSPPDKDHPVAKPVATKIAEAQGEPATWPSAERFVNLAPAQAKAVALPPIHRRRLDNGLRLIVVERHELPVVYFDLMVPGGNNIDPLGQEGQADLFASLLSQGTRHRSAEQWAAEVESLGGSIDASASGEYIDVSGRFLRRDLADGMALLADALIYPKMSQEELDKVRPEHEAMVRNQRSQPVALAFLHSHNMVFGDDDPRGRAIELASLQAVRAEALQARHQQSFGPDGAIMLVVGDVDPAKVLEQVQGQLGDWTGKAAQPEIKDPSLASARRLRIVDKADLTQASIALEHLGIARNDPNYLPLSLGNWVLGGGGFSSRLMKRIRSEGGKTYSVGSFVQAGRARGTIGAYTFTRSAEVKNTLDMLLDEISKAKNQGISDAELQKAKNNLAGGYVLRLQSPESLGNALIAAEYYGLGDNWVRDYPLNITAPTLEQVNAALKNELHPEALSIAVVGPAKDIKKALQGYGKLSVVDHLAPVASAAKAVTPKKDQSKAASKAKKSHKRRKGKRK